MGPPTGVLRLIGSKRADAIVIGGIPASDSVPDGGFAIDLGGDGDFDISSHSFGTIELNLGAGNDRVTVQSSAFEFFLAPAPNTMLNVNGGAGEDMVRLDASGASTLSNVEMNLGRDNDLTQANLTAGRDDLTDVILRDIAKILAFGTDGPDGISGAGGQGIGTSVQTPLVLSGGDGNDKLTGGAKADNFKGGAGKDTCNGGAGDDNATGCETLRRM